MKTFPTLVTAKLKAALIVAAAAVLPLFSHADVAKFVEEGKIAWSGGETNWVGGELVISFTDTEAAGSLTISDELKAKARVLLVAGGGSGGTNTKTSGGGGGGGGAGGLFYTNGLDLVGGAYTITVGKGGAAAATGTEQAVGNNGGDSSLVGAGTSVNFTVAGGGGGGALSAGNNGGCGGGGSRGSAANDGGTPTNSEYGFAGGRGSANRYGGGGGGASAAGGISGSGNSRGGAGIEFDISGETIAYAGGGGGGRTQLTSPLSGGLGGGGAGGSTTMNAENGVDGLGGGGGGSGTLAVAGAGGSGVVIIRIVEANEVKVVAPTALSHVWDGFEKTGVVVRAAYTLSGDFAATAVGTYSVIVTLNEGYSWLGKTGAAATEPLTVEWSITTLEIPLPVVPTGLVYNGNIQTADVAIVVQEEAGYVLIEESPAAINAGTYTLRVSLVDPVNSKWSDDSISEKSIEWKILPFEVARPEVETGDLVYNGMDQFVTLTGLENEGKYFTFVSPTVTNAVAAGTYAFTARLKNEGGAVNYIWNSAPETEDYTGHWVIAQAPNEITKVNLIGWKLGENPNKPSVEAKFGAYTATYTYATETNAVDWLTAEELTTANAWTPGIWYVKAVIPATADWAGVSALGEFILWENPEDIFRDKASVTIGGVTPGTDNAVVSFTFAENDPVGFSYDRAGTDGEGLLFLDANGNLLPYRVVTWDVTGVSTVKVRLASLTPAGTTITVYWGQKEGTVAPGSDAAGVTGTEVSPTLNWGLVEQDGLKVNYWVTVPLVDKTVWYVGETAGVVTNTPALAAGAITNYIYDVYAPTNTFATTADLTTPGFYRYVFLQREPTDGYAPISYEIDLRVLGDVTVTGIGGVGGETGRVLLMNRDTNTQCPIDYQGYSDTRETLNTFWERCNEDGANLPYNLQEGTEFVLWTKNKAARLWHLNDCRHGNTFPASNNDSLNAEQNYLPWSTTSKRFNGRLFNVTRATVGQIVMRNIAGTNACVYSSCFMDGIGTIYFDAVNGNKNTDGEEYKIIVQIATDLKNPEGTDGLPTDENVQELDGETVVDAYGNANWRTVKVIPYLRDGTPDFVKLDPTDTLALAVKNGGTTKNFYRVVVPLDIRQPVRFRIARVSRDETPKVNGVVSPDPSAGHNGKGYILLDNIIASYPAMAADLKPAGWHDRDTFGVEQQKGKQALGVEGAFSVPYPAAGEAGVHGRATAAYYENGLLPEADTNAFFVSAKMYYRWRYLDQETNDWASVDLNPMNGFRSMQPLKLPAIAGDVEFYFESMLHAPYYKYVDYSGADVDDFSKLYSEKRDIITNASTAVTHFESRGTDWYVRLRDAASDNRSVRLIVRRVGATNSVPCVLTADGSWIGYVQTRDAEAAGWKVQLEALVPETLGPDGGTFATNRWALAADRATLGPLPASVTLTEATTNDWISVPCDAATGYLMFKFDDTTRSLTVSHADYQNFNGWNDAYTADGTFVGTSTEDDKKSGVSSQMRAFEEDFTDDDATTPVEWADMPSTDTRYWQEFFHPQAAEMKPGFTYEPNVPFSSALTPNGWTAQNGAWAYGTFLDTSTTNINGSAYGKMALQLRGSGYGSVQYVAPADRAPRGLEKVSFRARLAQAIDFESMSFSYTGSMLTEKNYTFFAHASLNTNIGKYDDFDGDGTVSVIGYYQPMKGCYEFRVAQESLTINKNGSVTSKYRLSLYRWARSATGTVKATLLGEKRGVTGNSLFKLKSGLSELYGGLFISCQTDDANGATKIVAGLLNAGRVIGGPPDENTEYVGLVCTDTADNRLQAGTYGVTSKSCPAEIWNPRRWMAPVTHVFTTSATDAGELTAENRKYFARTKVDITSGTGEMDGADELLGEWAVDYSRYDVVEQGSFAGLKGTALPQQIAVDVAPAGTTDWTTLTNVTVDSFTTSTPYVWHFYTYDPCSVRLRHVGTDNDPRMDVVVDDISFSQWAGDDMGGRDSEWAGEDYSGWPYDFYFSSGWIKDNALLMSAKRTKPGNLCALRTPLMDGHGNPERGIGLGMISFEYVNAQENARLLLQVATNVVDSVRGPNGNNDPLTWTTLTNFNFGAMSETERKKGVLSYYLGLHGVQGTMRLLVDPAVIDTVRNRTDPKLFGEVTITKIFCRDEPSLDITCWWGWNLRMVGNDSKFPAYDDGQRAYLPDLTGDASDLGMSLALNNSTTEGCVADDLEAYRQHMPFVQTPTFASNIVGEITFRARLWGTRADEPQQTGEIALYAASSGDLTSDTAWKEIARFDVTNRFYTTYTYRTENSERKYRAFRLGVTGVKGVTDGDSRGKDPVHGENPVRVLIDEVAVYEAVWPTIGFRYAYPFRNALDSHIAVTGVVDAAGVPLMDEQPLAHEGWSVQAEIEVRQLPDEIDLTTPGREPRVYFTWYPSTNVWGYALWRTNAAARRAELVRADGETMIFRGGYSKARDAVVGSLDPQVVQYATEVVYWTKTGIVQTNVLSETEWRTPSWVAPLDYNKTYGRGREFSAWTVLDTVAPKRVWINEVNVFDGQDGAMFWQGDDQWVELAVPLMQSIKGWKLDYINLNGDVIPLCTFGQDGVAETKSVNEKDGYAFLTVQNPATRDAKRWPQVGIMDGTWANHNTYGGQLDQTSPVALRLTRANGVVEQEVVFEGEDMYAGTIYEGLFGGTNQVVFLNDKFPGSNFRYVGNEQGTPEANSLGVITNTGASRVEWSNAMVKTPGRVNEGQTIPLGYALYPNGELLIVTARISPEGHILQTFGNVVASAATATAATRKGDVGTNITYHVEKWWEIRSVTTNGVPIPGLEGQVGDVVVTIGAGQSNNVEVVATAQPLKDLREKFGLTEDNRYRNAIMDWLAQGKTRKFGAFKGDEVTDDAWYRSLAGATITNLTLTHRYWLDIDPTEPGWALWAGVVSAPKPYYADVASVSLLTSGIEGEEGSDPGNTPYDTVENFTVKVKMTITNESDTAENAGVAYSPYMLRGLAPGSHSYHYTEGSGTLWTSVTFKVTGDIQNNMPNRTRWVPLRYFVFNADSFDADHTATIDIWDPFDPYGSPETKGWSNYTNSPAFYSWSIDDRLAPVAIEPLKADSTFR